jgi:predicted DNA-binding transcriptional regulator AlpA
MVSNMNNQNDGYNNEQDILMSIPDILSYLDISNSTLYKIRINLDMNFPAPVEMIKKNVIMFSKKQIDQ